MVGVLKKIEGEWPGKSSEEPQDASPIFRHISIRESLTSRDIGESAYNVRAGK